MEKSFRFRILSLRMIYPLLLADVAVLIWLIFSDSTPPLWLKITLAVTTLLLMWFLWSGVVKPRRMVQVGMELLSAQEANNRLAPVGQPDADRIAELFNTLMGRLHRERMRLREQHSFLGQLIEASPMGVAIMDFDFHITDNNRAFLRLAGIPEDTPVNGLSLQQLPGNIAGRICRLADGESVTLRCDDHSILRCYRLSFMESGFRRPFILLESLTEEVMRAERNAYGKVIRLMAHEVNNSMTGITTLLDILSAAHADDPDLTQFIDSVAERCGVMSRFIGAYADVVRLPEPTPTRIRLTDFVTSHLPFLRSNCRYPVGTGEMDTSLDIDVDTDMLSQILVNIIKNSAEAIQETGKPDGSIRLSVSHDPQSSGTVLTIADNGCGISPEVASNLFNPFFSTKPDGQGIGLTMVAEILRRHNARFSLATGNDGFTRFRIVFPKPRD